jgi:hypothetical protein
VNAQITAAGGALGRRESMQARDNERASAGRGARTIRSAGLLLLLLLLLRGHPLPLGVRWLLL